MADDRVERMGDHRRRMVTCMAYDKNGSECRGDPIFVHSLLDDYGLSLIEFRLCARVSRRGTCFESNSSLANDFCVSEQTIRRAFNVLVRCKILAETRRAGFSNVHTVNHPSKWVNSSLLDEIRSSVFRKARKRRHSPKRNLKVLSPQPSNSPTRNTKHRSFSGSRAYTADRGDPSLEVGAPLTRGNDKGTPRKGTPVKVLLHNAESLSIVSEECVQTTMDQEQEAHELWRNAPFSQQQIIDYVNFKIEVLGAQIDDGAAWARSIWRDKDLINYRALEDTHKDPKFLQWKKLELARRPPRNLAQ